MTAAEVTVTARLVELGRLGPDAEDVRGRLFFWAGVGVICPRTRSRDGGWRCELVAADRGPVAGWASLSDADLARLPTTMWVDPNDPEWFALLWQVRVRQHWPSGRIPMVARLLAERLRQPGTLSLQLNRWGLLHLMRHTNCRLDGLHRILAQLAQAGYLTDNTSTTTQRGGRLVLSLPGDASPMCPASHHGRQYVGGVVASRAATVANMTSQVAVVAATQEDGEGRIR